MIPKAQHTSSLFGVESQDTVIHVDLAGLLIWLLVILLKLQSKLRNHVSIQREDENRRLQSSPTNVTNIQVYNPHNTPLCRSVKTNVKKRSLLFYFILICRLRIPESGVFLRKAFNFLLNGAIK